MTESSDARSRGRSAYLVQYSEGEFGNMAWTEHHVVSTVAEVQDVLAQIAASPPRRRQVAFVQDGTVGVWVVQQGNVQRFIDLRSALSTVYNGRRRPIRDLLENDATYDAWEVFDEGELPLFVDQDQVAAMLPALQLPTMGPGDSLDLNSGAEGADDGWLENTGGSAYGSTHMIE